MSDSLLGQVLDEGFAYLGKDHFLGGLLAFASIFAGGPDGSMGPPDQELYREDENCAWAVAWRIITVFWWLGGLICVFGVFIGQAIAFNGGPKGIDELFNWLLEWAIWWPGVAFSILGIVMRPGISIPVLAVNLAPIVLVMVKILCFLLIGCVIVSVWEAIENRLGGRRR